MMVERQKAVVVVLNDTRRDDVNKDPLGGDGKRPARLLDS
jgi:hypothetical protein